MSESLEMPDGRSLPLDELGYLLDWTDWTPDVAEHMAGLDDLALGPGHWRVIDIVRDYYGEYEIAPPVRALIALMKERAGDDGIGSRELYRLFPEGPAKQACRYAGLPKPVSCI